MFFLLFFFPSVSPHPFPAVASLEARRLKSSLSENLEARLVTLREEIVDTATAEGAVELAQVRWWGWGRGMRS